MTNCMIKFGTTTAEIHWYVKSPLISHFGAKPIRHACCVCYLHWHPPISNLISKPVFASPDWSWSTAVGIRLFPLISFVSDFLYPQQLSAQHILKASFFCCSVWITHQQSGAAVPVRLLRKQSCCCISVLTCNLTSTEWLRTVNHILAFS